MSANLIRWERANDVAELGFAGSHEPWLFQIWTGGERQRWQLITATTLGVDERPESADPDELKQQAETWLQEFASSFGAVFTADLREQLEGLASGFQDLASALAGSDGEQDWREACDHAGRAAAYAHVIELLDAREAR